MVKCKTKIAWMLSLVLVVVAVFANVQITKADTNPPESGGPSDTITLDFSDGTVNGNDVTYTVGESSVTLTSSVNIETNKAALGLDDIITVGEGFNPDTMEIVVYAADGFNVILNVSESRTSLSQRATEGGYPGGELRLVVREKQAGDPPPGSEDSSFSGSAYFVWRGADDKICAHLVEGLDESKNTGTGDESAYKIIYIPVSEVKDDVPGGSGETYNISNNDYYWMWDTSLEAIKEYSNYTEMNEDFERNENLKRDLAIDPTEAVNGASTVCTNGNRDFRATIYADTFEGLDFSVNPDDYTYFPDFWDSVFASNTVDISGSTAENPAVYESFLLEPTVHFSTAVNSANAITGIKALDVPAGAVAITGDATNGYDIKFNSNFFDSVVFEITTASENYYLEIVRTALQVHDNFGPDMTEPGKVIASLYYDEGQDYRSYEVYATIYNSDGTTTMKKAEAVEIDMDNLGNPMPAGTYVREAGKGLKYSNFAVEVSDDVVGVAFNVVEAGALSGESYGGSYLGSGIGAYYDIETREVVY